MWKRTAPMRSAPWRTWQAWSGTASANPELPGSAVLAEAGRVQHNGSGDKPPALLSERVAGPGLEAQRAGGQRPVFGIRPVRRDVDGGFTQRAQLKQSALCAVRLGRRGARAVRP